MLPKDHQVLFFNPDKGLFKDVKGIKKAKNSGDLIALWLNNGSYLGNAIQSDLATRPHLQTNAINGKNAVVCGPANNAFELSAGAMAALGDFTCSFVAKVDTAFSQSYGMISIPNQASIELTDATTIRVSNDSAVPGQMTTATLDSNWHLHVITKNGSSLKHYKDGTLDGTGSGSGNLTFQSFLYNNHGYFKGSLGKFRIYDVVLDSDQLALLTSKEMNYYGL